MYYFVVFLSIILFSTVKCSNVSTENAANKTLKPTEDFHTLILASEGASGISDSPLSLAANFNKESVKKSVVPKKEANYNSSEDNTAMTSNKMNLVPTKSDSLSNDLLTLKNSSNPIGNQSEVSITHSVNVESRLKTTPNNTNPEINNTKHKKPLILSYTQLANSSETDQSAVLEKSIVNSSPKVISDQINSPIQTSPAYVKIHPMPASRHPDMIMPIVITILVVPMFAILGYMVLRRGQEAWKNRHYKRVDFLLDGMYND